MSPKLPGSRGCLGLLFTFVFNPLSLARGNLCAHFFPNLSGCSLRARRSPTGTSPGWERLGEAGRSSFPSPFPIRVGSPLLGARAQGRSPAFWLLPGTAARRPAAALWLGGWARRGDRPFQPALRAAPPRCSWALWAAGEAGTSAWLSLLRPPGLRKFGTGCTKFPLGWRIPCRPAPPPTPATFCRVLSPSSPLCFLSGPPHTPASTLPCLFGCSTPRDDTSRRSVQEPGEQSLRLPPRDRVDIDTPAPSSR